MKGPSASEGIRLMCAIGGVNSFDKEYAVIEE